MEHRRPPLNHSPVLWDVLIALCFSTCVAGVWIGIQIGGAIGMIILSIFTIGFLLIAYGSFVEPKRIILNKKSIQIPQLPRCKVAVIGDLHIGPYIHERFVQRVVDVTNTLKPDLILLVGDFLFDHHADTHALRPLEKLHSRYGVFGILGNHDAGEHIAFGKKPYSTVDRSADVTAELEQAGISVLRNTSTTLHIRKAVIAIAGLDDYWIETINLPDTLKDTPDDTPLILLSHNPDVILLPEHNRAALIVSGHTHGGQIRLPFIGSLHSIPDRLGRKYDQGIFRLENETTLAITHGVGETQARARLFCPPEILVLDINQ